MIGVFRREQSQAFTVETDAVQMGQIRVFAFFAAAPEEIHFSVLLVDVLDLAHDPIAAGDLILELAGFAVEIKMIPAVALGGEKNFAGRVVLLSGDQSKPGPSWNGNSMAGVFTSMRFCG